MLDNKYSLWYKKIIEKAKSENRKKLNKNSKDFIYYERHHIIPRCLGGGNNSENLVLLTAREHFICHMLLIHSYANDSIEVNKLKYAITKFLQCNKNQERNLTSRNFEYLRKLCSEIFSERTVSDYTKRKISVYRTGKFHTKETKNKLSKIAKKSFIERGYVSRPNMDGEKNPMYGKVHSKETKDLMTKKIKERGGHSGTKNPMYGKVHSKETIEKQKKSSSGKRWFNNGESEIRCYEELCPSGWKRGRVLIMKGKNKKGK